jgi:nucleotide-binding universal stress UspA family protein
MGTIIVGVDGTETAGAAALTAARLAVALDHDLVVVCGYGKDEVENLDGIDSDFTTSDAAAAVGEQTMRRLRAAYPAVRVSAVAEGSKPADALLAVAARLEAELIVVGNKRVQGAARILGSIASDVARRTRCDLYVAYTHAR